MEPQFKAFKMIPDREIPEANQEFYSLPVDKLPDMVIEYVSAMETQRTNDWCKCQWILHPEDVDLDIHNCGRCHHPRALHTEMEGMEGCTKQFGESVESGEPWIECRCEGWVDPPKRRMRRGDNHPLCPVHTKEGFLIGFFNWLYKEDIFAEVKHDGE